MIYYSTQIEYYKWEEMEVDISIIDNETDEELSLRDILEDDDYELIDTEYTFMENLDDDFEYDEDNTPEKVTSVKFIVERSF